MQYTFHLYISGVRMGKRGQNNPKNELVTMKVEQKQYKNEINDINPCIALKIQISNQSLEFSL